MPAVNRVGDDSYEAEIRWTTHGVPHITAGSLGSVAFGQGYACPRDHLATIADQVLKVRSERSAFLGPGERDCHLYSDLGYLALGVRDRAERAAATQTAEVVEMVEGYAAGVSAWLEENGRGALPAWCRDADWVRPIDASDLFCTFVDLAIIASGRNLAAYIGSAGPPGVLNHPDGPGGAAAAARLDPGLGSNGWALGHAATSTGRGMVVANPHFPWGGEARFWECHLRVPGELDVYGAGLIGTPGVQIGMNRHVAWTHTFSRGHRFTVYRLDLVPDRPTSYRYGAEEREMSATTHRLEVLTDSGEPRTVERTLWSSHYGPMLDLPLLGWSEQLAFTYRDANLDNDRLLPLVLDMDRARSVHDLREAIGRHHGLPWVNTVAADDRGRCWYVDSSTTPNLSHEAQAAFTANVDADPLTNLLFANRVALLDGSDPTFEWIDHADAPAPGLVPFDELPQLERPDYVFNSNDPYWLPHHEAHLPEHSPLHGLYRRQITPRSRMNALLLAGEGPVVPSGPDGRFTPADLEEAVLGNHSLIAELLLEGVIDRCRAAGEVGLGGEVVDLTPACDLLEAWDRRFDLGSVGAVIWRELLASLPADALCDAGVLFAEPYDPDRPIHTPRGLAPPPAEKPDPLPRALAEAVVALGKAGIPLDAQLGDVQYVERGGRRVPLHGAYELEGIANVVAPIGALVRSDLEPEPPRPDPVPGRTERTGLHVGGYPATYGTSFVMVAWFDEDGPHGRGLLAYGQSGDPDSPRHVDQVEAFSRKELRPFLLDDDAIAADPALETKFVVRLRQDSNLRPED